MMAAFQRGGACRGDDAYQRPSSNGRRGSGRFAGVTRRQSSRRATIFAGGYDAEDAAAPGSKAGRAD